VNRTMSRPTEILVAFMKAIFLCEFCVYRVGRSDVQRWALGANACCASDRLRAFCHNQHSQYGCCIANVSRNLQECLRHGCMLFRQSLEPRADTVELIDFAQDRCKRHRQTAFSLKSLRWENFRMDWLRSEDLKEEKDVTAPTFIVAGTSDQN
jgi:hypothetical protein